MLLARIRMDMTGAICCSERTGFEGGDEGGRGSGGMEIRGGFSFEYIF